MCESLQSRRRGRKDQETLTARQRRLGPESACGGFINNDRIANVHEVAAAYRAELQERQGIRQAEIVTARELSEQERGSLVESVGQLARARVQATFKLDKDILGGTIVRIGSTVYDGSVRGRLERLREELASGQ